MTTFSTPRIVLAAALVCLTALGAHSEQNAGRTDTQSLQQIQELQKALLGAVSSPSGVNQKINPTQWKLGDAQNFYIMIKGVQAGTLSMKMDSETQTNWIVTQTVSAFGKSMSAELLYNKTTGDFAGARFAGVMIPLPTPSEALVSRGEQQAVVEAGIYNTQYSKTDENQKVQKELWTNTAELPLLGWVRLKTVYKNVDLTCELFSYARIR